MALIPQVISSALSPPWWVRWIVVVGYSALVAWLMLAPAEIFMNVLWWFPHIDKFLHFCLYGFLVLLLRWAIAAHCKGGMRYGFLPVTCAAILYGVLMEIAQSLLAGYNRSFEWMDLVSNSLGALCFWFLWDGVAAWWQRGFAPIAPATKDTRP